MQKTLKSAIALLLAISFTSMTMLTGINPVKVYAGTNKNIYQFDNFVEKVDCQTDESGNIKTTHIITNVNTGEITKIIANDRGYSRSVDVYENNRLEKQTIFDKQAITIKIQDTVNESVNSKSIITANSSTYPYLQSLWHNGVQQMGYLYGEESITYGSTYKVNISEGTAWATVLSIIAGIVLPGSPILGVIAALGISAFGAALDTAINGQVYGRFDRWDYEVYSQGELGLKTYQKDIDQKVIDSNTGNVTYIDISEEGYSGDREDMLYEGIYNVHIWNL